MESFHLTQRCQTIKEESPTALPAISSTPPGKIRAGSGDVPSWLVAAALAVPPILFMLASRGNWLFDMGGADNWQYVKYFQAWDTDDLGMRERMDVNYKGSRVPWIVPGYLAHLLLGPDLGTIVLHATVLILSAWCLYLIVATFFQARIALLTAILAVGFPGFQASGVPGFWNYHGAAANLYLLAGLYFLARSFSAERKDLLAMASGACLFAALLTTFIYAVQGPALIVFAAACWRRFGPQPLLRLVAMACLGALAITLAFALASWATGGRFWFFMAQWAFLGRAASNNLWAEPLGVWLPQAGWLSATLATAIASVAFLLVTMGLRSGEAWFSRAFIAQFWLAQLALIACDLFGQNAFQTSYVQYTAVASTFLALAGMAAVAFGASLAAVPAATLAIVAILVTVPPQVLSSPALREALSGHAGYAFVIPTLAAVAVLAAASWLRRLRAAAFLALAAFALIAMLGYERRPYALTERCYPARSMFPAIAEGSTFISSLGVVQTDGALWYEADDRLDWAHGCAPMPLAQFAFPLMHAGLVRPLGTPDRLPLDAVQQARPSQLDAFFIASAKASAPRLKQAMASLTGQDGSYDELPFKQLEFGTAAIVVRAYRRRQQEGLSQP